MVDTGFSPEEVQAVQKLHARVTAKLPRRAYCLHDLVLQLGGVPVSHNGSDRFSQAGSSDVKRRGERKETNCSRRSERTNTDWTIRSRDKHRKDSKNSDTSVQSSNVSDWIVENVRQRNAVDTVGANGDFAWAADGTPLNVNRPNVTPSQVPQGYYSVNSSPLQLVQASSHATTAHSSPQLNQQNSSTHTTITTKSTRSSPQTSQQNRSASGERIGEQQAESKEETSVQCQARDNWNTHANWQKRMLQQQQQPSSDSLETEQLSPQAKSVNADALFDRLVAVQKHCSRMQAETAEAEVSPKAAPKADVISDASAAPHASCNSSVVLYGGRALETTVGQLPAQRREIRSLTTAGAAAKEYGIHEPPEVPRSTRRRNTSSSNASTQSAVESPRYRNGGSMTAIAAAAAAAAAAGAPERRAAATAGVPERRDSGSDDSLGIESEPQFVRGNKRRTTASSIISIVTSATECPSIMSVSVDEEMSCRITSNTRAVSPLQDEHSSTSWPDNHSSSGAAKESDSPVEKSSPNDSDKTDSWNLHNWVSHDTDASVEHRRAQWLERRAKKLAQKTVNGKMTYGVLLRTMRSEGLDA
jgi:hypothetical protein